MVMSGCLGEGHGGDLRGTMYDSRREKQVARSGHGWVCFGRKAN